MITEMDLREAIAECEGTRNPNASTCIKLAAYYTILNNLHGNQADSSPSSNYSFASEPMVGLKYTDSEFSQYVMDKGIERVFPLLDELMDTLMVVNPKLYDSMIMKISEI